MSFKVSGVDIHHEPIGRSNEIEQLAAYRRAASEGHGCIVLIGGEAGIGKSTLLRHFETGIASGRTILASSRCVEFIQTPLAPLRDVLERLERRATAPRDSVTRSLVERLKFWRADADVGWLPEGSIFDSIDTALMRYAARGTVVLTVEDVHWADRSTLAFLTYLADRLEKRRIVIVATYRTDELGSKHPNLAEFSTLLSKRAVRAISLGPLSEESTRDLVEKATHSQELAPATIAEIIRRSQGNPFFTDELTKSAVVPANHAGGLPLSIRSAVLAQASRLSDADRNVVSLAAVLGERFAVEQLIALSGEREAVLCALEQARMLRLLSDESTAPGEVAFRHALTQEVMYGELLAERVRPLHEAIATELEERPNREVATVELAHHWRRAGDLKRAAAYEEQVGDKAFAIGALADAIFYYQRALTAHDSNAGLEHKLGVALGAMNELHAGIERLRRAAELYWQAGDYEAFAENASAIVAQLYNSGDAAGATTACREAIATLTSKLPRERLDLFRTRLAFHSIAALDDESASAFLDEISEPIADSRVAMHVAWNRFRIAAMRGEIEQWRALAERSLDEARKLDDGGSWVRHLQCQIALDAIGLGDVDVAREYLRAAMLPQRERRSRPMTIMSAVSSFEHTLRGDFGRAQTLLHDVARFAQQSYPILVHVKSAEFTLGICLGDDSRLHRGDTESFLRYGAEHGIKLAIGLLGGPYAWALGLRGETAEAAAWIGQISRALPGPHRFLFAYLAAAQFGEPGDVRTMRGQLVAAGARPQDRVNKAALGLFDAFAARRGIVTADLATSALDSAARFDAIGWPWLAALGYELGGDLRRASETFRSLGSVRDLERLERGRTGASASVLSSREHEVAQLVSRGHSNEEIAQILHISPRTAEKHVSSALKKLNLRSRLQLGQMLARSQTSDLTATATGRKRSRSR